MARNPGVVCTILVVVALLAGGCSGGGGGGGSSTPPATPTSPAPAINPPSAPPAQPPAPDPAPVVVPAPEPAPAPDPMGGGGAPPSPPPPGQPPAPLQATLTTANVDTFVSQTIVSMLIGVASQGVTNYDALTNSAGALRLDQNGCVRGSVTYILNAANTAGTPTSASYAAYENCAGLVVSGSGSGTGAYTISRSRPEDAVQMDLNFSDLQYTRKSDGATFRLAGTIRIVKKPALPLLVSTSFPGYVAKINASLFDATNTLTLSMQDFVVDSDTRVPGSTVEPIALSGRIIDPVLGFVDVISPKRLTYSLLSGTLSGSFAMQGATTQAVVTLTNGAYTTSIVSIPVANNPLDAGFGVNGKAVTDFITDSVSGRDTLNVLVRQPDGKLLAAGSTTVNVPTSGGPFPEHRFALVRYNADGSLDTTFGNGGKVITDIGAGDEVRGLVVQPDGKIVAAGTTNIETVPHKVALARYNADGSLDTSFGTDANGVVIVATATIPFSQSAEAGGLLLQPDGKLILIGTISVDRFALIRFDANGVLDSSFGSGGIVSTDTSPLSASPRVAAGVIQPDGKIVVGGSQFGGQSSFELLRYNPDGTLDSTFGNAGRVHAPATSGNALLGGLVMLSDGSFVACGLTSTFTTPNVFTLARYKPDGSFDPSFGANGIATAAVETGLFSIGNCAVQADGKVVVMGTGQYGAFSRMILARFDTSGTLDTSFGSNGFLLSFIGDVDATGRVVFVLPDGKLVAAGSDGTLNAAGLAVLDFLVARYLP